MHYLGRRISLLVLFMVICLLSDNCRTGQVPVLTTLEVRSFTPNLAISGGSILNDGGESIITRGVCWDTRENPTVKDHKTSSSSNLDIFESTLSGLVPNTTYYVRAYATNRAGVGYGSDISFTTSGRHDVTFNPNLTYGTVADIERNVYKTIPIGTQTWMAENLKTKKYRDGSDIGTTKTTSYDVNAERLPKYQWPYDGIEENVEDYGRLYTFHATTDPRGICPAGWHVPTDAEWNTLIDYLINNGYSEDQNPDCIGKPLSAKSGWDPSGASDEAIGGNQSINNKSGFTALPAGFRTNSNYFENIGESSAWWTSTVCDAINGWMVSLGSTSCKAYMGGVAEVYGLSVRCIKD
jgi:uncharacterized protein (TIGR02145 family)